MKAVAAHAFGSDVAGQAEELCDFGLVPVKRRIEASDLRHVRHQRLDGVDAGQVVRLMQRREGGQRLKLGGAHLPVGGGLLPFAHHIAAIGHYV